MLKSTAIKRLSTSQVTIENEVLDNLAAPEIMKLIRLANIAGVNITVSAQTNLNVINGD